MKKILSIVLAIALLFSVAALTACSKKEDTAPADTVPEDTAPAETDETTPAETAPAKDDVQARLDAGEEVIVAMCVQGLDDGFILMQHDFLKEQFEALGFVFSSASSEGNVASMIEQIENYTVMNAVHIIVMPPDTDGVKDAVLNALDNGVQVTFMGLPEPEDYQISGGSAVLWDDVGDMTVDMAISWLDARYPQAGEGEVHVAFSLFSVVAFYKTMCERMIARIEQDPRCQVTVTQDMCLGIDDGFTFAEDALTSDGEVRLFLTWQDPVSMGVSNYIMSQPDLVKADYATFSTGVSGETAVMVQDAAEDKGVYRGTTAYGSKDANTNPAEGIFTVAKKLIFGEAEAPLWNYDAIWTVDSVGFNGAIESTGIVS